MADSPDVAAAHLAAPVPSPAEPDAQHNSTTPAPLPFANPFTSTLEQANVKLEDDQNAAHPVKQETLGDPGPLPSPAMLDGAADNLDEETAKAIAAAQNEYGTRVRAPKKQDKDMVPTADVDMSDAALKPASTAVPKKRPPPKSATTASKTSPTPGIKKPPPKKRKVEPSSDDRSTPASSKQSPTPSTVSARASKTPAGSKPGKASRSATPKASSPYAAGSPGAASDLSDDQIYCICRKPDDHTFMIGCDGVCDDWFHGKCVNIRKDDESLIDKFVCPNCTEKGIGVTTWKPMCRREGCRKPARLKKGEESKYCSRDCGVLFMRSTVRRAAGAEPDGKSPGKKTKATTDHAAADTPLLSDHREPADSDVGPLGGRIRTHELKSLAQSTSSVDEFRSLGSAPMITPPPSTSPEVAPSAKPEDEEKRLPSHTDQEQARLAEIAQRKATLRLRRQILKDRGQFVTLMKAQRDKTAERLKIKDVCGFDSRWSLDDLEFKAWRDSDEGRAAFDRGSLDPSAEGDTTKSAADSNGEVPMADEPPPSCVCLRKRCERHRQWQKLVLQDVRFEETDVGNEMRRIDAEEREIKQRAADKARELERYASGIAQSHDGWVEVVTGEDRDPADAMDVATPQALEGNDARMRVGGGGVESAQPTNEPTPTGPE